MSHERKDTAFGGTGPLQTGTSYTTHSLKRALASVKIRKALEDLRESFDSLNKDPTLSPLFEQATTSMTDLLTVLEKDD